MAEPLIEWQSEAKEPSIDYAPAPGSHPVKQFIAGVSDIGTGLPTLAGLAGQGLETLYNYATDKPSRDEGIVKTWDKAGEEGVDKTLQDAGDTARHYVEGKLGVGDAVTGVDQVARALGTLIPVPGAGTAATLSRGSRLARNAYNLLTPAVKYTTPGATAIRAAAQAAIGTTIDQGIRAYGDRPTLFSDGGVPNQEPSIDREPTIEYADPVHQAVMVDHEDPGLQARLDADQAATRQVWKDRVKVGASVLALALGGAGVVKYRTALRDARAEPGIAPVGRPSSPHPVDQFFDGLARASGRDETTRHILSTAAKGWDAAKGYTVDSAQFVKSALKDSSMYTPSWWETMQGQIMRDSHGMSQAILDNDWGGLPPNSGFTPKSTVAPSEIHRRLSTMSPDDQHAFALALASRNELATSAWNTAYDYASRNKNAPGHGRWATLDDMLADGAATADDVTAWINANNISSRVRANLWGNTHKGATGPARPVTQQEMRTSAAWLQSRPDLDNLAKELGLWMDDSLDYVVARGQMKKSFADKLKASMQFGGSSAYVPGMTATEGRGMLAKMTDLFGITTTQGKETQAMAQWYQKAHESGAGILAPENALIAAGAYAHGLMKHLNTTESQRSVLFKLTNLVLDQHGMHDLTQLRPIGQEERYAPRYIGTRDIETAKVDLNTTDREIKKLYEDSTQPNTTKSIIGPEAVWLRINGKEYGFHVPHAGFRQALEINPALTGTLNKTMNAFKRMMTAGTTGAYSLFAPIAGVFAAQQLSLNRVLGDFRPGNMLGALGSGATAYSDAFRGAKAHFVYESSRILSNALKQGLETNTGISSLVPGFARAMIPKLERAYQTSIVRAMRKEFGTSASGPLSGSSEFGGHVTDILSQINPQFSQKLGIGGMQVVGKVWMALNRAAHEGAATGATMAELKRLGAVTPDNIRSAMVHSKDLVGDVRRRGANTDLLHAAVPFSGATIQSIATIGRAIQKNPKWAIPALAGVVGIPTVMEMGYNQMVAELDDTLYPMPDGTMRTQNDYYWNVLTDSQRADNMVMLIPGVDPHRAVLIPVSPELGVFRSMVLEGMDGLFNFSDVGNAGMVHENGHMWGHSVQRFTDIAIPPPLGVLGATMGIDIRAGIGVGGQAGSLITGTPLVSGQKLNSDAGTERYVNSFVDKNMEAVIKELFGAAGAMFVSVADAFHTGLANPGTDLERMLHATGDSIQALGLAGLSQLRPLQTLFPGVLRPSSDREITSQVMSKKGNLKAISNDASVLITGGFVQMDGTPIAGNSLVPSMDPVYQDLALSAKPILSDIDSQEKEIGKYKMWISSIGTSTNDPNVTGKKTLTPRDRLDLIDGWNLKIDQLRTEQLWTLKNWEQTASQKLSGIYGRPIHVDFSGARSRPSPSEGSLLPAARSSYQGQ
jgi:hypothetical protein